VRDQIIDRGIGACLEPGVLTFDELATRIAAASQLKTRPVSAAVERELLRRVVAAALAAGGLKFYGEAAGRAGFVDSLAEHFRELNRRDIRPAAYARIAASRGQEPRRQELARLYSDYEARQAAHGLVDGEGRYWAARDALASGDCPRFEKLELIVVDGFTDFTRMQLEILGLLAQRAKQLYVSLPMDESRADLFAKSTATLRDLQTRFGQLDFHRLPPRPGAVPALDHLAQNVFRHPHPPPPADALASLGAIEIVEAASAQDEIVQLARRIKQQLAEKGSELFCGESAAQRDSENKTVLTPFSAGATKPGNIVVVFRSVAEAAPRIEAVFRQFGIPFAIESSPRIARAAVFRTLAALLQLDVDDWPFRRVVSVVTNNSLSALADDSRRAADWLVRDLQVAKGRRRLLELVDGLAAQQESAAQFSDHHQRRIKAAASARLALSQLAAALDRLPQTATATEWCAALEGLSTELGFSPAEMDRAAWQAVVANFAALEQLDAWLGQPPRKLNRRELLALLIEVATHEDLPQPYDETGRVRILSAKRARGVSARHLYLAGLSEQAFPAPVPAGRLAGDAEYRFLSRAAHQQQEGSGGGSAGSGDPRTTGQGSGEDSAPHSQEEMLLFYEVLSRADQTLTISYPAMDEKAQELPPSPYVVELKRIFGESEQQLRCAKPQLSPVPHVAASLRDANRVSERLVHVGDWRLQAVAEAIAPDGDQRLLAGLLSHPSTRPLGQAIDAGIRIVQARAQGEKFGPSEGLLASPAVTARLAERFGPLHRWSPSQWETYAACPFRFFLQSVLKLEPLGDLALETDYARRGSRLHAVLAAFHRGWAAARESLPAGEDAETQFKRYFGRMIDEQVAASPHAGIDAALLELDRRQILKWADRHFEHHNKYQSVWTDRCVPMQPSHLEFRFGSSRPDDKDADPESHRDVFTLEIGGEQVRVTGQIDRVDVGTLDGKTVFNVIDYKSGGAKLDPKQLATGQQLQLPIYMEAAKKLLFAGGAAPLAGSYWTMGRGFDAKGALDGAEWSTLQESVHALIRQFIDDIRHGNFPVASRDDKCTSYCDFSLVCRIGQARSANKLWWEELIQPVGGASDADDASKPRHAIGFREVSHDQ
jgi:ATP-dependent helicase/DNAse subunit B